MAVAYPSFIQRAAVVGLERFVGRQWVALQCDHPGCQNTFPADGVGVRNEYQLAVDARAAGWTGEFTRKTAGDRCPKHSSCAVCGIKGDYTCSRYDCPGSGAAVTGLCADD